MTDERKSISGYRQKNNYSATPQYFKSTISEDKTNDKSFAGLPSMTYCATSTVYKYNDTASPSLQFFGLMTTFTATYLDGRLSLTYVHEECGQQLRCIKDTK